MEIELTAKQAEYVRESNHRWNFAVGAVRSGKSHLAVQYTIPKRLRERHGERGINLILGASKENIERNVLTPMRDIWGANMVSDINTRNWATMFGEKVYCIGAEKINQVSKLRGSEVKYCYCDEIVDINKEVFEMLKSRLSLPYSCCDAAANPAYPSHYVKKFIDSAAQGVDIYSQEYTIYDNPFLPPEYVRDLENEYRGTVYFDRYILGKWTQAEGLIYPMYASVLADPPGGFPSELAISVDYGTQNAFAAIMWGRWGETWYGFRGYYYSGRETGVQKTDEDYGRDLDRFVQGFYNPGERIQTIIDPSAASFIALLHKREWCKVRTADNDVANGIRETASAMQCGLIKVSPSLTDWKKEVEGYIWDDTQEDKPVKENDHYMDATRYFVKTKRIMKKRRTL